MAIEKTGKKFTFLPVTEFVFGKHVTVDCQPVAKKWNDLLAPTWSESDHKLQVQCWSWEVQACVTYLLSALLMHQILFLQLEAVAWLVWELLTTISNKIKVT